MSQLFVVDPCESPFVRETIVDLGFEFPDSVEGGEFAVAASH
jgi:hypothetical protein